MTIDTNCLWFTKAVYCFFFNKNSTFLHPVSHTCTHKHTRAYTYTLVCILQTGQGAPYFGCNKAVSARQPSGGVWSASWGVRLLPDYSPSVSAIFLLPQSQIRWNFNNPRGEIGSLQPREHWCENIRSCITRDKTRDGERRKRSLPLLQKSNGLYRKKAVCHSLKHTPIYSIQSFKNNCTLKNN